MAIQPGGRQLSETAFDALSGSKRTTNWSDLAPPDLERDDEVLSRWKGVAVLGALLLLAGLLYFVSSSPSHAAGSAFNFTSWGTILLGFSILVALAALFLGMFIGGEVTVALLGAAGIGFLSYALCFAYPKYIELFVAALLVCGVVLLAFGIARSVSAWIRLDKD